jgi:RHH-type proline utilization regulon transcriptional repressor/proline dehydrogenase/delta 1-pyrroline-5-carboxylate dehydrogenase
LTTLDEGERWLVEPQRDVSNPRLWSPGIKLGVREGSMTHTTEFFGPVLGVMRADDLDHALRIANATSYGLTAGLHSLDEREQQIWSHRMHAGNLYINRPITGAIVQRQPFGGHKASNFGPGAKAGGPNYVLQMVHAAQRAVPPVVCPPAPAAADFVTAVRAHLTPADRERLSAAACSYAEAMQQHFAVDHDPSQVLGERNVFRYLPFGRMLMRAAADASPLDVLLVCVAARTVGVPFHLSLDPTLAAQMPYAITFPTVTASVEDASGCANRVIAAVERVRTIGLVEPALLTAAEALQVHVSSEPVLLTGRIELLRYHREQSISHRFHRYGNLGPERLLPPLRGARSA